MKSSRANNNPWKVYKILIQYKTSGLMLTAVDTFDSSIYKENVKLTNPKPYPISINIWYHLLEKHIFSKTPAAILFTS